MTPLTNQEQVDRKLIKALFERDIEGARQIMQEASDLMKELMLMQRMVRKAEKKEDVCFYSTKSQDKGSPKQ